jgi:hypothetical protein
VALKGTEREAARQCHARPNFFRLISPGRKLPWCINIPAGISETGGRERRFFALKIEAKTFAEQTRRRATNQGVASHGLTSTQREVAAACFRLLEQHPRAQLLSIVREHLAREQDKDRSVTFLELKNSFLAHKPTGVWHTIAKFGQPSQGSRPSTRPRSFPLIRRTSTPNSKARQRQLEMRICEF